MSRITMARAITSIIPRLRTKLLEPRFCNPDEVLSFSKLGRSDCYTSCLLSASESLMQSSQSSSMSQPNVLETKSVILSVGMNSIKARFFSNLRKLPPLLGRLSCH